MALLDDNLKRAEPKPTPGQGRSAKPYSGNLGLNPDWEGGQKRGPISQQDNNTGLFSRPTIDQDYAYQAFRDKTLGPLGLGKNNTKKDSPFETEYSDEEQAQAQANRAIRNAQASAKSQTRTSNRPKQQLPKINLPGFDVKARITATRVTVANATWVGYIWLFVQLPLAILSIAGLGIVASIDSVLGSGKTEDDTGVISWLVGKTVSLAASAIDSVLKFINIDFAEIAFHIFMACYVIILAVGIISILVVYLQYVTSGLRPTTGRGGGLKMGMLVLAIIGYSTPILNLFPFIFLWMGAVWYNPK